MQPTVRPFRVSVVALLAPLSLLAPMLIPGLASSVPFEGLELQP
jgi:hypothetical protein